MRARVRLDEPKPSTASAVKSGHARNGRFTPGNQVGRGKGRALREWREAFRDCFNPTMLGEVTVAMHRAALHGDVAAAKLLFEYSLGRPSQKFNVSVSEEVVEPADLSDPEQAYLAVYV